MKRELPLVLMVVGALVVVPPVVAQEGQREDDVEEPLDPAPDEVALAEEEGELRREEELTVFSVTKVEQKLVDAPATMSVITGETLERAPAQNMSDALRPVPGIQIIQNNARDFNLTARQATSTLATSTLVTVDGRSVYLDFFGLVLWDFVPSPTSGDIEQIEVVRGPASVVWGANAVNGVVNVITKTPRKNPGFGVVLGTGLFDRDGGSRESEGNGYQLNGGFSFADAIDDTWSYKLNAGYFYSEPYSRPVGNVPLACHPLGVVPCRTETGAAVGGGVPIGGAPYPADANRPGAFENDGTSQPKFDLRVDQEVGAPDEYGRRPGRITYEGGYGGTQGIVHSGIGPFDLQSGSYMAYGRVVYNKEALRLSAFGNFVDAEAPNLLVVDPDTLGPIILGFKTQTYDLEFGNSNVLGADNNHLLTYGGNYRRNNFDISLAEGPDRNEFGAYGHWEYFVGKFRLAAGVRADKFGNLARWVWSPRVSVMFKPTPYHSIRASYNRAFVSPSFINNYLDQNLQFPTPVDLTPLGQALPPLQPLIPPPFLLTINTFGNPNLREQVMDAYEVAYTGTFGRTTVGLAAYLTDTDDNINFTYLFPEGIPGYPAPTYYGPTNPATGVTVPTPTTPAQPITLSPFLMGVLAQVPPQLGGPILLPEQAATYLNLGPIRNRGIEASIDHQLNTAFSFFANYSWQDTPKILSASSDQIPYPINEVGLPSEHRFNAGFGYDGAVFFGNASVNYASDALWMDVLNATYAGFTDAYTMLNGTVGVKLADGKVILSLKGMNLTNEQIQQHVFGDLLKRSVVAEARLFVK
jgi:outer membrane receptor protein involved in Fe transport